MAFIESGSEPSMLLESHLFSLPSTLTERWNTKDTYLGPSQATFDEANDITFTVAPCQTELVSLADIRFSCDLYVTNASGATLTDADVIAPVNNILHSLFQTVNVSLAGRNVSDSSPMYHMRAYLESLLGFTVQAQLTQLTSAGFSLDTDLNLDPIHHPANDVLKNGLSSVVFHSAGAEQRRIWLRSQNPLQLSGKLHCDLFQQHKPLIPGVELCIKLVRNKNSLLFLTDSDSSAPRVVAIRNPRLKIRKYEPSPDFLAAMSTQLITTTAKYHIERVVMRQHTLLTGQHQAVWSNLVIGQLPKVMLFGIVPSRSFSGEYKSTPYNFHHYNLSTLNAEIDGQIYPTRGYNLDYSRGCSLEGFEGLLDTLERLNEPQGELPFDRDTYNRGGFNIYGFDFTRGHTGRGALALIKHGNLNINLKFASALIEPVVCVAMLIFDNVIEINNNRQAVFDFAP